MSTRASRKKKCEACGQIVAAFGTPPYADHHPTCELVKVALAPAPSLDPADLRARDFRRALGAASPEQWVRVVTDLFSERLEPRRRGEIPDAVLELLFEAQAALHAASQKEPWEVPHAR